MTTTSTTEKTPPASVQYVTGDATAPQGDGLKIIAHVVNDMNRWGAGFTGALSRRWSRPETEYRRWMGDALKKEQDMLGTMQLVPVEKDIWVANIVGQHGVGRAPDGTPPIRYDALSRGLDFIAQYANDHPERSVSVHAPRLGAGLAGGSWDQVESLLKRHLVAKGVPVTVYDLPS